MLLRTAAVAVYLTALLAPVAPASAADADVFYLNGSGSIAPGLDVLPTAQAISFNGIALVAGTDGVLVGYPCNVSAIGLADSVAEGFGYLSGSCGPIRVDLCVWARGGTHVTVTCVDGVGKALRAEAEFKPENTNPVTSYSLTGLSAYAHVP